MSVSVFKTFAFTIRPLDGVTDEHVSSTMAWCRRNAQYYHIITEKSGSQRHIHAGVFLKKERSKGDVCKMLLNLFRALTPQEKSVLRQGVKIMYNWDFISVYLDKDDETEVIGSNLPEKSSLESWFPPKPVSTVEGKTRKCSIYYHELEALWYKHQPVTAEVNTVVARDFLFKMMYSLRVLPVIRDDKMIVQTARHLVRWLNKAESNTIELPVFEKEE